MAIPAKVSDRLNTGLNKYKKLLEKAKEQGANEADTSSIIHRIIEDVLGYDMLDITAEYRIRGQYADYALKVKDKPSIIIEVKSIALVLNENHLTQATTYAAQHGITWAILTNGAVWQLYKLSFGRGIDTFLVFELDLLDKQIKPKEKINLLYTISKEGFTRGEITKLYQEKLALSTANISKVILSNPVLEKIKRELRAKTGYKVSIEDLSEILKTKFLQK